MERKQFLEMVPLGQIVRVGITGEEEVVGQVKVTGLERVIIQTSNPKPRRIRYTDIESVQLASSPRCSSLVDEA